MVIKLYFENIDKKATTLRYLFNDLKLCFQTFCTLFLFPETQLVSTKYT